MSLSKVPLHDLPIAVLDFETTGLSASADRVVQVGVVHCQGPSRSAIALNSLINPQRPIDPRASAIHGINDRDVVRAPTFGDLAGRLLTSLEGRVIAAYNAAFDLKFLRAELRRTGLDFESPFICVMELRQMIFAARRCRLVEACGEMGIQLDNAHDASADASATAALLRHYFDLLRKDDVHTIEHLRKFGQRAFVFSFQGLGFAATISPVIAVTQKPPDERLEKAQRECERMNLQASEDVARMEGLLATGLGRDVRVRWERLMTSLDFREAVPVPPAPDPPKPPDLSLRPDPKQAPSRDDPKYAPKEGILGSLIPWIKEQELKKLHEQYQRDLREYRQRVGSWNQRVAAYRQSLERAKADHAEGMRRYQEAAREYQAHRSAFLQRATAQNARIATERAGYEQGNATSVTRAMTRVLMNSQLPPEFPDVVDVDFDQAQGLIRAVRAMPSLDEMPAVKSYRVIKKDGELKEQPLSDASRKRLFDSVVYQLALRTIDELFRGDTARHVRSAEVRCVIDGYDPATGHPGRLVIARLSVDRERFQTLRLANVDPETCFKDLGGATNGRPSNLKPIDVLADSKPSTVTEKKGTNEATRSGKEDAARTA